MAQAGPKNSTTRNAANTGVQSSRPSDGGRQKNGKTPMNATIHKMADVRKHRTGLDHALVQPDGDLVEKLGRELGRVVDTWMALEAKSLSLYRPGENNDHYKFEMKRLTDRMYQIEEAIPTFEASTVAGALVSILRANSLMSRLEDQTEPAKHSDKYSVSVDWKNLTASLYSAMSVLRSLSPGLYEACAGDYYMEDTVSPFLAVVNSKNLIAKEKENEADPVIAAIDAHKWAVSKFEKQVDIQAKIEKRLLAKQLEEAASEVVEASRAYSAAVGELNDRAIDIAKTIPTTARGVEAVLKYLEMNDHNEAMWPERKGKPWVTVFHASIAKAVGRLNSKKSL